MRNRRGLGERDLDSRSFCAIETALYAASGAFTRNETFRSPMIYPRGLQSGLGTAVILIARDHVRERPAADIKSRVAYPGLSRNSRHLLLLAAAKERTTSSGARAFLSASGNGVE